jgi:hypothetical protein
MGSTHWQERRTYALARGGRLVLDPLQPCLAEPECWFAMGRVIGSWLRVARFARLVVELRRHAPGQVELTIRPVSRTMTRWGNRRRERYFDLELIESRALDGRTQELIYRPTLQN